MSWKSTTSWSSENLARVRKLRNEMTTGERLLWEKLRRDRLGFRVRRQVPIGAFVVDFYVPSARLAIELDGDQHIPGRDAYRDQVLRTFGVEMMRIRSWEPFGDEVCVALMIERIVEAVESRPKFRLGNHPALDNPDAEAESADSPPKSPSTS